MPTYSYRCNQCRTDYDAVRSIEERHECPLCPKCALPTVRFFAQVNFARSSAQTEDVYNHSLGAWTRTPKDAERIVKQRNYDSDNPIVLVDPRDTYVNDEGLYETTRAQHDNGQQTHWLS